MSIYDDLRKEEKAIIESAKNLNEIRKQTLDKITDDIIILKGKTESLMNCDNPDDIINGLFKIRDGLQNIVDKLY